MRIVKENRPRPIFYAGSLCMGVAFVVGIGLSVVTCSSQTILPVIFGGGGSVCTYPRGCYLVESSGQNAGQCGDCTGGPDSCRLFFVPTPGVAAPLDLGGVFRPEANADLAGATALPAITDEPVACSLYPVPAGLSVQAVCATPESLCVGRGPVCDPSGGAYCVRAGASCETGAPISPQRRPGTFDTNSYCPYTNDVCCPSAPVPGDGGTADAQHD